MVVARGLRGRRNEKLLFNGLRVPSFVNAKVLDVNDGDGCTTM